MSSEPDSSASSGGFTSRPRFQPESSPEPPEAVTRPLTAEDLITLNEEIAAMAKAGLPLDQGLRVLAREMSSGRLKALTEQLARDLNSGVTLPDALARQKDAVPSYYAALLAAGIRAGKLGEVLGTLTVHARAVAEFRSMLIGALFYPAIILVLGVALLTFVSMVVLPAYLDIFATFRMQLPFLTRVLLFIGQHPIEILIAPPVGLILGLVGMRFALRGSARGRVIWARFVNALPIVGTMIRSARLGAFTDLLGILVDQSIPLPEALRLACEASSDALLREGGQQVEEEIRQGAPLGIALYRQRLVPELIVWMVTFGEKQGTLGTALHQLAIMYRRKAEVRAAMLRTVLPPILILFLSATLIAVFVFGVTAPMYEILDALGGGK